MSKNISSVNNISCSGSLTISNNIISTGNIQTSNISSTSINNSNSITTNSINATTGSLTNTSINVLTLLANTPIIFNYNGSNYNLSTLMLFTLNQLAGASIASQNYVNQQISNLVNSSPDLLNTLSELAAAINNDANFSTTMTNLIATKVGLISNNTISGNNTFSGTNTFSGSNTFSSANTFSGSNTFSSANTFTGSNTFNSSSGNIIDRLFSTILSVNNGNTRRNVANFFEVGMGQTSSYIYYDNTGKFGSINATDSTLNWNKALNSVFNIKTINSTTENVGTLNVTTDSTFATLPNFVNTSDKLIDKAYVDGRFTTLLSSDTTFTGSNNFTSTTGNIINRLFSTVLSVNNGNTRRNVVDYFEVGMGQTSSYIYYNNEGKFGSINTTDSSLNWNIALNSVFTINTINSVNENISGTGIINNLYSNILAINNNNTRRATNDIFEVATSSTGNYLYYNNSSTFGHINTSYSASSWFTNSSGAATLPSLSTPTGTITTLTSTTGTITNLYSNILAVNNNNQQRATNDIFEVATSSTGNYIY